MKVSESFLRDTIGTSKGFLSKETPNIIEESRRARLDEKNGQYRELKREAVSAVGRDKMLTAGGRGGRRPPVAAHSVVFQLERGNPPEQLETGRCRTNLERRWWHPGVQQLKGTTTKRVTLLSVPGKVLARILLDRNRQKLLTYQRQSVYAHGELVLRDMD